MKTIIEFFVKRSFVVNLVTVAILVLGVFSVTSMNRDLIPAFKFQKINVSASLPGASSTEVEQFLAFPIESALSSLPGVETITSNSKNGYVSIGLHYKSSHDDMQAALEKVRSQVDAVRSKLPLESRDIYVSQQKVNDVMLARYIIEGVDEKNAPQRKVLENLGKKIAQVKGVVRTSHSLRPLSVYIEFDAKKLDQYGIPASSVRQTLANHFRFVPIGELKSDDQRFAIEMSRSVRTKKDINKIPIIGSRTGSVVMLGQIAKVDFELTERDSIRYVNGEEAFFFSIYKDTSSDSIDLRDSVHKEIEKFNKTNSVELKLNSYFNTPYFIEKQLKVLFNNGLIGLVLVVLCLMFFLNWRTALMTAIGVPIAYLGTMVVLFAFGVNIDLISVIGLILVIGILVDDAIIVSERYVENLQSGMNRSKAATEAVRSLMLPVTGTVLTTIVAFSPLILIKSELSEILFAVPVVVIASLAISWIESFFILPNHLAHFVKNPPSDTSARFMAWLTHYYKIGLNQCLRFRYILAFGLTIFLAYSVYFAGKNIRQDFHLRVGANERVKINITLKKSDSFEETKQKIKAIEEYAANFPKEQIERFSTHIGAQWKRGRRHEGFQYASIRMNIDKDITDPSQLKIELVEKIEKKLKELKTDEFQALRVRSLTEGEEKKKGDVISVSIRGDDSFSAEEVEKTINEKVLSTAGITGEVEVPSRFQKTWEFIPNSSSLIRYGMSRSDLATQIKALITNHELGEIRISGTNTKVYTRIGQAQKNDAENLAKLSVLAPNGNTVPLRLLGKWQKRSGLKEIWHRNGLREWVKDYHYDGKKIKKQVLEANIEKALLPLQARFVGHQIELVQDEETKKNTAWALKVALVCLAGVLTVLALILGSLVQPIIVALPIPFGIIGIIWALHLHNLPMGIMAIIGLIGVIGVAVNDSLVMTDQINRLSRKRGKTDRATLIDGAASRLRAIILTTITTLGGVLPMAYGIGGDSGFTKPLAFSIGWGLAFATILTLFALPAFLEIRLDSFRMAKWIWRKISKQSKKQIIDRVEIPVSSEPLLEQFASSEQYEESNLNIPQDLEAEKTKKETILQ